MRRFAKRALLILVAPALLASVEIVLRLANYGESSAFFIPSGTPRMLRTNERYAWRFMAPEISRAPAPLLLAAKKTAGTKRIFVLGSSAAQGFPDPAYGVGRFLEVMLNDGATGRFEVINCAMTAISSHVIREIAGECAKLDPDYFLVYCGNNEVIGPFGPGTVFKSYQPSLALVRLQVWFSRSKLSQALRDLNKRLTSRGAIQWGGMDMFAASRVAADDPRLPVVRENFRQNLEAICGMARGAGARVILCTVPVNLRDCPPFSSSNRMGAASAQRLFESGKFQEACDADELRFRADSGMQRVIREVAADRPGFVTLADLALPLDGAADFHEHVHLNLHGSWRAAALIFASMADREAPAFEACITALAFTPFDEFRVLQQVEQLRSRPPFTAQTDFTVQLAAIRKRLADLRSSFTGEGLAQAKARYAAAMQARPADFWLAANHAALLDLGNDAEGAAAAWRRVVDLRPQHLSSRTSLALALGKAGRRDEARALLDGIWKEAPPLPAVRKSIGDVFVTVGDLAGAKSCYREALRLHPDYPEALANLATLLLHSEAGRESEAEEMLRRSLAHGGSPAAQAALASLLAKRGDLAGALPHFEAAVAGMPGDASMRNNLGAALLALGRREEAAVQFEEALRIAPGHAKAGRSLELIRQMPRAPGP